MEIYLVGGAVRDQLLGREVTEKDWVVVGASPEEMIALGYNPVGKDFPVFLHPDTNEEYALARTERKTGKGYKGFVFNADPSVSLEDDLIRRDLTINAMAQTQDGTIIDPFNGQADLAAKQLKHVSEAFAEDPVRILRIARFAARLPDFSIHPVTNELMIDMVRNGEVDALVPERVWKECYRALEEAAPWRFFDTLDVCGALAIIFPEITVDSLQSLSNIVAISSDGPTRFAALLYRVDSEHIKSLCKRVRVPSNYQEIATLVVKHQAKLDQLDDAEHIVHLLESLDCYRRPNRLAKFVLACAANNDQLVADKVLGLLENALMLTNNVDAQQFVDQGLKNEAIGKAIRDERVRILRNKKGNP